MLLSDKKTEELSADEFLEVNKDSVRVKKARGNTNFLKMTKSKLKKTVRFQATD